MATSLPPLIIAKSKSEVGLMPAMANRHGLIAGATGTGKTVTLQVIAEKLSQIGVPIFMADVKGDLSGLSQPGGGNPKIEERRQKLGIDLPFSGSPVTFWDVWGEQGHPVRTTISEMGPLLLGRLLNLNETQTAVLTIVFKVADDQGLLLLDLKDLRSLVQHVGDNSEQFTTQYGNVSPASIGAIQRGLLTLEEQGGDRLFGEPGLNLMDFIQTDSQGRGVINILSADKLMLAPKMYATLLLWLLSELFEKLPEVGDMDKPKLVFFFDEAHLLFTDAPPALQEKIEQVVRLIRSKGVGIYFVSQNPMDIPEIVLGQLGNRVQHALRAFTPKDQKTVKAAAETFVANPKIKVEDVLTQLGVGEALVSFLDAQGRPNMVEQAFICPPQSQIGPIPPEKRKEVISQSVIFGHYEKTVDRESAFELLKARAQQAVAQAPMVPPPAPRPVGRQPDTIVEGVMKSAARAAASQLGRQIMRGVLGSILGGGRGRKSLFLIPFCMLIASFALAGAWPREKKEIYSKIGFSSFHSDEIYGPKKNKKLAGPDFSDLSLSLYGEYGFTEKTTGIISLTYKSLNYEIPSAKNSESGFGDAWFYLKKRLTSGPLVMAMQFGLKVPMGYDKKSVPPLGQGQIDWEERFLIGKSLTSIPVYMNGELAYRKRMGDYSDEMPYRLEAGWFLTKPVLFRLSLDGIHNLTNDTASDLGPVRSANVFDQEYMKLSPGLVFLLKNGFGIELYYETLVSGANAAFGQTFGLGFSWQGFLSQT